MITFTNFLLQLWDSGALTIIVALSLGFIIYDLKQHHKHVPTLLSIAYDIVSSLDDLIMSNPEKKLKAIQGISDLLRSNGLLKHFNEKDISNSIESVLKIIRKQQEKEK